MPNSDNLIKLESEGDDAGAGKGHTIYTYKNKRTLKDRLRIRKFNPLVSVHTWYKESK